MKNYPSNIKFKYSWREYQKRVLDDLDKHLDDNHLHIIAPPGSGKTVLGLEVALRLNKPTLVFAPTVAIRNQWIQRFCELFLQVEQRPDWISRDIKNPKFLTVVTYQGLHAAFTNVIDDEEADEPTDEFDENGINGVEYNNGSSEIIELIKAQNFGTIVVDEAHHLKNAWWQSLSKLKQAINPTVVGLTATPPYDVSHTEWQRYLELNGPVDAEISVPELVVEGDLCPHQDYVLFSQPTAEEAQKMEGYRMRIKNLFEEIQKDEKLIKALMQHPIYSNSKEHLELIYSNIEYYSAILIFLNAVGKPITKHHIEVTGNKKFQVPELTYEWMENILTFYLYKDPDNFAVFKEHQERLVNKLKRGGVIEKRAINFRHNRNINSYLSSSISKLKSIEQVVEFEYNQLQQDLRMVILTDYIRKEFLVDKPINNLELNKIGVLPIFEQLRRANHNNIKIGVLTGSLIIIPIGAIDELKSVCSSYNIENVSTTPLPFDENYVIINSSGKIKHDIVHIITEVFEKGEIEVLVGTKSLLGEGWDAPSINSLILASFVGSYVLSNQMRGRAIRTERKNLDKTSNIWHLVCIDPTDPENGNDLRLLKRRFKSFVGISFDEFISIENGIGRLNLPEVFSSERIINDANDKMLTNASKRELLKQKWDEALTNGRYLIEEIKIPFPEDTSYYEAKSLYFRNTVKYLLATLGSGFAAYTFDAIEAVGRAAGRMRTKEELYTMLLIVFGLGVVIFGGLTIKAFKGFVKYRDISKDIYRIGQALLEGLIKVGVIKSNSSDLYVITDVDKMGAVYCHLQGGSTYEKSAFIKSLQEIVEVIDNPRYIIIRKHFVLKLFTQKDYHSVPEVIGRKKQSAVYFHQQWSRFVGANDLVYTRTLKGRETLLKSRINSLASLFQEKSERINKWR